MAFLSDATNRKANSTMREDLDYDKFLSEPETSEAVETSYEIPPPPPGITVIIQLDNNPKMILKTEHHQQLGNSFDYSNSDLHNVINIGRNAKTVIINKGEDHEEVEAYSPTSNYRIRDIYGYNSQKRHRHKAAPPFSTKAVDHRFCSLENPLEMFPVSQRKALKLPMQHSSQSTRSISNFYQQRQQRESQHEQYTLPLRNSACQLLKRVIYWAYPRPYTQ